MQRLSLRRSSGTPETGNGTNPREACPVDVSPKTAVRLQPSFCRSPLLAQFIPGHRRALMAAIAYHFIRPGFNALPMSARWAHRVCQWEDSPEPFDHTRLAADDRPPFRRMIADLEEATIDRHVVPVDVEDDDVARGAANDGIPCATPQRVRARRTDASPTLHLQPRRRDHSVSAFHDL